MKPIFAIDLTENKKNEQPNGNEFLVQTPSPALVQALENSLTKAVATTNNAKLPLGIRIIECICGFLAIMILIGTGRAEVTLEEAYQNAPALFWIGGACAIIWFALWLWGKLKSKKVLSTEESAQSFTHLEGVSEAIYTELGVPATAREVDVLSFYYKRKGDDLKVCEKGMQVCQYLNPVYKLFSDEENIYLANLEGKYAFSKSAIVDLKTVEKHIRIAGWNKEAVYNKGVYQPYKLTIDQYGCVHCKQYHILVLEKDGQQFGLYFPCYELPHFKKAQK